MTVRERVWRLLCETPMKSGDVARTLGISTQASADACFKLRQRGLLIRMSDGNYEACGTFVPDPRKEGKPEPERMIPCALAECWGWMPNRVEAEHA